MRKILLILSSLYILDMPHVFSQTKLNLGYTCSYYGEKTPSSVYTFASDNEAVTALKLITDASGLAPNFKILASDVPNAAAVIINNQRFILYNQTFMYNISQRVNYWASISILAHEIGHHLNGHSLVPGGSRPSLELEADKFSGFILAKLGASLKESQSAINALVSETGSTTHPGRSARLAAIANGWYQNKSTDTRSSNSTNRVNRPSTIQNLAYKKLSTYLNSSNSIQVIADDYVFDPSEYKIITINTNEWSDECVRKNPQILIIYMIGYEKYYYAHDYRFDPNQVNINLKTIYYEPNPYMFIGGKCFEEAYYKGELLEAEARIPTKVGYTSAIWNGTQSLHTYTNGLDLYLQLYGPGYSGSMIPEPAFLRPPVVRSNPYYIK